LAADSGITGRKEQRTRTIPAPTQILRVATLDYLEVKTRLEQAALAEEPARWRLSTMASTRRTWDCGIEVARRPRKGAIDYASVPNLATLT
jgi:hypothetical protein